MSNILVISDNSTLAEGLLQIAKQEQFQNSTFSFQCSKGSEELMSEALGEPVTAIKVKEDCNAIIEANYDLVISAHCKQLFPSQLTNGVRCVNVHPGFNPFNRGWFPQVFSIINKLPAGATIHEIDEQLDHGGIIAQETVPSYAWDTSIDIYNRVLEKELQLLRENLPSIIANTAIATAPKEEGNLNLKKDYNDLCELDLSKKQTVGSTIDLLRALTHGEYQNAYYIDVASGKKVYVSVSLNPE